MTVGRVADVAGTELRGDGIEAVVKKVLVSPAEGWDGWVMRVFELGEGGHTPRHRHEWPHVNVVLQGAGRLNLDGVDHEVSAGSYAFVPAGALHQFANAGSAPFAFVCIVPAEGDV